MPPSTLEPIRIVEPSGSSSEDRANGHGLQQARATVGTGDQIIVPKNSKSFAVSGGYQDIRRGLLARGWEEVSCQQGVDFRWSNTRADIDFESLQPPQLANHYERIGQLCTKHGLNVHLEEMRCSHQGDIDSFYPRTFHIFGLAEIEAFTTEYKLRKTEGILKEWVAHITAGRSPVQTFSEDVVNVALAVAKRYLLDIDALLTCEDNPAELYGFEVQECEWAVLMEVDMLHPEKEVKAVHCQKQARVDHARVKDMSQQALARQVANIEKVTRRRQDQEEKRRREKLRLEKQRGKLKRSVLGTDAQHIGLPPHRASDSPTLTGEAAAVILPLETSPRASEAVALPPLAESPSRLRTIVGNTATDEDDQSCGKAHHVALPWRVQTKRSESSCPIPRTIPLASDALRVEVCRTLDRWRLSSPQFYMNGSRDAWIVKPASRARGEGIFVSDDLDAILDCARKELGQSTWICQKYIEAPLLLGGRKNDIRQWVLVTSWNPLTVWFYGDCYVRLAAEKYSSDNLRNTQCHLTNNAVACHHSQFNSDDDYWRCMWDLDKFRVFLSKEYKVNAWEERVLPAMKRIVLTTLTSIQGTLASSRGASCCFELLGYDFLVAADLSVWLLEINTSPSMEYSTAITRRMVPEVLEDTLRVVLGEIPITFQLLHTGPAFAEELSPTAVFAKDCLVVVGQQVKPQLAPSPPPPGLQERREASKRLAERRLRELDDLAKQRKQQKDRETEKAERRQRLRKALREKVLVRGSLATSLRKLSHSASAPLIDEGASQDGERDICSSVDSDNVDPA